MYKVDSVRGLRRRIDNLYGPLRDVVSPYILTAISHANILMALQFPGAGGKYGRRAESAVFWPILDERAGHRVMRRWREGDGCLRCLVRVR